MDQETIRGDLGVGGPSMGQSLKSRLDAIACASSDYAALAEALGSVADSALSERAEIQPLDHPRIAHVLEETGIRTLDERAQLSATMARDKFDPIMNVTNGAIFSFRATDRATPAQPFLAPGAHQLAAGYVLSGPSRTFAYTFGDGVEMFNVEPGENEFRLFEVLKAMPPSDDSVLHVDATHARHWSPTMRVLIDDSLERGDLRLRWSGQLTSMLHHLLLRGGVILAPELDNARISQNLPLLSSTAAPVAFLVDQAGGRSSDGRDPIMELTAESFEQRTPLFAGDPEFVVEVARRHAEAEPIGEGASSAHRGLFRG